LVRSRPYFVAAKRNRPYRQLWKQFGLVLAGQVQGNGRIAEVAAGSLAEAKNLHVGDLIIAVNGVTVASPGRLIFLLMNAPRSQSLSLLVQDIIGVARTVIIERR
jgi:S1-C subfamily serine protease